MLFYLFLSGCKLGGKINREGLAKIYHWVDMLDVKYDVTQLGLLIVSAYVFTNNLTCAL